MKKIVAILALMGVLVVSSWSQTQLIHDFVNWSSPNFGGVNDTGWLANTSANGVLTNQGALGGIQFGGVPTDLSAYAGGTVNLSVDLTSLVEETANSGLLVLNIYSQSVLIDSFSWQMSTLLGGGVDNLSGTLSSSAQYSDAFIFELTQSGLNPAATPTNRFSATFSNLSITAVPEPSSFALMGLGMGALYLLRRRR